MANFSKYTRPGTPNLFAHYDRNLSNNSNKDIDSSRTHLNYNLAQTGNQNELLSERLSQVKCLKRKDVNVLGSWVVTLPKDYQGEEKAFFKATYDFLETKYGKKNVISAYVHKDEKQPHLHFAFVPVVLDKNKNIEKVSAKECVTKLDLISFHTDLQNYLEKTLGQEVHILNGATVEGNLTVRELKIQAKEETLQAREAEAEAFEKSKKITEDYVKTLDEPVKPLPKLVNISNIGTVEALAKNFPTKKTGTFSHENPYEYGNRMTNNIFSWLQEKFYDPLKDKCNKLLQAVKDLKKDNELKNSRINTLERENRALNLSVDKVVEERLESRSKALVERSVANLQAENKKLYGTIYTDRITWTTEQGIKCNAKTGILTYASKTTDELMRFRNMTPSQFRNWYDRQNDIGYDR